MLNSPDPHTRPDPKQEMEALSEQIDISQNDFISAANNIKENLNKESERFHEELKDLKDRIVDLSGKSLNAARQTIASNLGTAKCKANHVAHYTLEKAEKVSSRQAST